MRLTLESIVKGILGESVSDDAVLDAIDNKYAVRIKYDDGEEDPNGKSKGSRVIQPFAYGYTKAGHPVVRAFQLNGNSRRGAPNWKFFRLDRITSWRPMRNKTFSSVPDHSYGDYNYNGDRLMEPFVRNAQFDKEMSPLDLVRDKRKDIVNGPKVSVKNTSGPIVPASRQWSRNVFTSQPNSKKYQDAAKYVTAAQDDGVNRFDDDVWALARKEAEKQDAERLANNAPKPNSANSGPIETNDDYDVYDVDFDENDFENYR